MAGRPRIPKALHLLRGNPGKRRLNDREPEPTPTDATPPPYLVDPAAIAIWAELAPEAVRIGTLTSIDRREFARGCRYSARGDKEFETGSISTAHRLHRYASYIFARFGVGASDRSRITAAAPVKQKSKWEGLIGGKRA